MDRESTGRDRFSQEEMSEILEMAARLDGPDDDEITRDDLTQIASELGISEEAVRQAMERKEREAAAERAKVEAEAEQKASRSYEWRAVRGAIARVVPLVAFFLLIDLVTDGSLSWWFWPVIGLSIPVVGQLMSVLLRTGDENGPDEDE